MQILKDNVKGQILEAAKRRFKERGFDNTSIKDIAEDAKISVGNIYRYFKNKERLLEELLLDLEADTKQIFLNLLDDKNDGNTSDLVEQLNHEIVRLVTEYHDELFIMLNCKNKGQFIRFKDEVMRLFTTKIERMAEYYGIKNPDKILCGAVATAMFEGCFYIVRESNLEDLKNNLKLYRLTLLKDIDKQFEEVAKKVEGKDSTWIG
ncbi:MAG: TetR/AcrR family transcriptional regulator [Clostridia bacterium]|nr:TetR/AcrR family transcriptional regulator [Clostridia bacterium]